MPLVMRWPEHLARDVEVPNMTQNIDFGPTFLDLAGVPVPKSMHGDSMVPLLEAKGGADADEVEWRDAIYYHYYESQAVHMVPAMYGVRTERFKLVRYYEPQWDTWEMFDLQEDPSEMRNVAEDPAYAPIRKQLEERLAELRIQYRDDTGQVGGGVFPITTGVARATPSGEGYRVWFNAPGGYLMKRGARAGAQTLSTTMSPLPGRLRQNGFLLLTGGGERGAMMRVGVESQSKRLVVQGPRWRQQAGGAKLQWDGASPVEVVVKVDFDAHELVAEALGQRVTAPLPDGWSALTGWGYGGNNSETVFGPITFR
jgi:hypothetical protein